MTPPSDETEDVIGALAEEYLDRLRRGERPEVTEYCDRHPELADRIAAVFPTMAMLEDLAPSPEQAAHMPAAPPAKAPLIDCIGDYRVLRELGRGGMGIVYEAEQKSLGRRVAIKILPPHGTLDPTRAERFEREARAVARLHHTNIVPIFGVGEQQGLRYYVMQYIRGQGLDQVLREIVRLRARESAPGDALDATSKYPHTCDEGAREASPERREVGRSAAVGASRDGEGSASITSTPGGWPYWKSVARIGVQVANALGYANSQGILHRDIKPSNLLLDARGTVWVTDFGLAKLAESDDLTRTGDVVGTLRYLAPEKLRGQEDLRGDIYSLGATLYELLTLRPPFQDGDRPRLLQRLADEEPHRPRAIDSSIPRDLETIVLKAMAKSPGDRYQTTEQLAEDLRQFLQDRPVAARRLGVAERTWRWCRRNPIVASLTGIVFGLLATLTVVFAIGSARLSAALAVAGVNLTRAEDAERAARLRLAEALVGEARGVRTSGREGRRFAALETLAEAAQIGRELKQAPPWFDRPRNEAIAALALPDLYLARAWPGWTDDTFMTTVSADFLVYARVARNGDVSIRRTADDAELARLDGDGVPCRVVLSPNGRDFVRHWDSGENRRSSDWFRVVDGTCRSMSGLGRVSCAQFVERPEGLRLICVEFSGFLGVYDVDAGVLVRQFDEQGGLAAPRFVVHPSEPLIAITSYRTNKFMLRDFRTGDVLVRDEGPWNHGTRAAWHPGGRLFCLENCDGPETHVYVWDPVAKSLKFQRVLPLGHRDGAIAFNRSGDRVIQSGWDERVRVWDFWTGAELVESKSTKIAGTWPIAAIPDADGTQVAMARKADDDHALGAWSLADGREYRRIQAPGGIRSVGHFALHPGARLAAQSEKDGVHFYDLATGAHVGLMSLPALAFELESAVCFDGLGRLYTSSREGVFRWPVTIPDGRSERWTIGPPTRLPLHPGWHGIVSSDDGAVLGQAMWNGYGMHAYAGGWNWHSASPLPRWFDPSGGNCAVAAVSPDGRWIVSDVSNRVCDVSTGKPVWKIPSGVPRRFSRSGKYLLTHAGHGRAYATGSWTPGPDLGPGALMDCTRDDAVAILSLPNGVFRLVEMATGRELARLEDPDQCSREVEFSPDGTQLIARADVGFRVWDLRRIRQELAKLELDWDAPQYSPAPPSAEIATPIDVRIVGVDALDASRLGERTAVLEIALEYAANSAPSADERHAWRLLRSQIHAADSLPELVDRVRQYGDEPPEVVDQAVRFAVELKFDEYVGRLADARTRQLVALHDAGRWSDLGQRVDEFRRQRADDPLMIEWAGIAAALRGDYPASSAHFGRAATLSPDDWEIALSLAESLLLAGEQEAYQAIRDKWLRRELDAISADDASGIARLASLSPATDAEGNAAAAAARRAVEADPANPSYLHALGMAYLRQGHDEAAATAFRKSLAADPKWTNRVGNWLGLALTHARTNQMVRAGTWLLQAQEWLDAQDREANDEHAEAWRCIVHDRLANRILRREAEQRIDLGQKTEPRGQ